MFLSAFLCVGVISRVPADAVPPHVLFFNVKFNKEEDTWCMKTEQGAISRCATVDDDDTGLKYSYIWCVSGRDGAV
jgi:hypothetical protein